MSASLNDVVAVAGDALRETEQWTGPSIVAGWLLLILAVGAVIYVVRRFVGGGDHDG